MDLLFVDPPYNLDKSLTWIRRIRPSPEAAKHRIDRLVTHVVEFHQFLTIG